MTDHRAVQDETSFSSNHNADSLRILVVDDNEASAKTMGWTIEMLGHDARIALDGADALATALDYKPDVIMLDLGLPGLNGYELCRIMQDEHGFKNTLFIAQTGWGDPEHRRRSRDAGFSHHLLKPIDNVELEKILKSYSAQKQVPAGT